MNLNLISQHPREEAGVASASINPAAVLKPITPKRDCDFIAHPTEKDAASLLLAHSPKDTHKVPFCQLGVHFHLIIIVQRRGGFLIKTNAEIRTWSWK